MKYLGIDFGEKRIGLAVSEEEGKMAFPHSVVLNNNHLHQRALNVLEEILKIIEKEKIGAVVMGESKDFKGEPNKIMAEIEKFKKDLEEKTKLSVFLEPEFLTSYQASRGFQSRRLALQESGPRLKRRGGEKEMHDASAAAIILQSFLDRKNSML